MSTRENETWAYLAFTDHHQTLLRLRVAMHARLVLPLLLLLFLLLLGMKIADAAAAPVRQPLQLTDVLSMRRFAAHAPLVVSADGLLAAYVISRPSARFVPSDTPYTVTGAPSIYMESDIWITDLQSGQTRDLTGGQGANWAAAWSPDGRTLAFCSDRDATAGLWLWDRTTDTLRRVGDFVLRAQRLEWSPDGEKILIGLLPEGTSLLAGTLRGSSPPARAENEDGQAGPTVQVFSSERTAAGGPGTQNIGSGQYSSDLAMVDIASGTLDRIARGVTLTKTAFSPNGRHIAFGETTGDTAPGSHALFYTLSLFSLDERRLKTLVPPDQIGRWGTDFSWSPDSRMLAYRLGHDSGDVRLISVTGQSRSATNAAHPPFKGIPAWDQSGERLLLIAGDAVWSVSAVDGSAREIVRLPGRQVEMLVSTMPTGDRTWLRDDGRSAVVVASDGIRKELHRVWLDRGGAELLFDEQKGYTGLVRYNLVAAPATGRIAYVAEDAQHPEDLWITDSDLSGSTQLTRLNPKISAVPMGALRIVEWTGDDGLPYIGALLLPSGYEPGKRYPLVVHVYPLHVLSVANNFGSNFMGNDYFNLQLLATRGYAVLYSGAVLRPADREPMRSIANAVLPGIEHVVEQGMADPDRIGVFGMSAGSYSTLALIVQSSRFKVAMAQGGPGNLLSLYGDLRDSGYSHGLAVIEASFQMPEHPWKERDRYIRNSPWFFLDRVETPLLLIHGAGDTAAIVNQSNEVFLGLKRLGKPVQYARYKDEGHTLSSFQNRLDAGQRFLEWFDRYLKSDVTTSE